MVKHFKLNMSIVLLCIMFLSSLCILSACGERKIEDISIYQNTLNVELYKNETLDTQNFIATIHYEDGTSEEVNADELEIGSINTSTLGAKNLSVTYLNQTFNIVVKVYEVRNISLKEDTLDTTIFKGDTLDTSSMEVDVLRFDGTNESEVTVPASELTLGSVDTSTKGTKNLDITYKGFQDSIAINVIDVESVEVVDNTFNAVVVKGNNVDTQNLQIRLVYSDNSKSAVIPASSLTIGNVDTSTIGVKQLPISYQGNTYNIDVTVVEITDITLVDGMDTAVKVGDTLDYSDARFRVTYSSILVDEVLDADSFDIVNISTTTAGNKMLNISYLGYTDSIVVSVLAPNAMQIINDSIDTTLVLGFDTLDTDSLEVRFTYLRGLEADEVDASDLTIGSAGALDAVGTYQLPIQYKGVTFNIDINVVTVASLEIVEGSVASRVATGSALNTSTLQVKVHYSDSTIEPKIVQANVLSINTLDTTTEGLKDLVVSYKGAEVTKQIEVVDDLQVTITDIVLDQSSRNKIGQGKTFDKTDLVFKIVYSDTTFDTVHYSATDNNLSVGDIDTSELGPVQVDVSYMLFTDTIEIQVVELALESIHVVSGFNRYIPWGENIQTDDIVVYFTYNDGDVTPNIDATELNFDTSGIDNTTLSTYDLGVGYEGEYFTLEVEVVVVVEDITLVPNTVNTTICQGRTLDTSSMEVVVTYNNEYVDTPSHNVQATDLVISTADTSTVGTTQITITYKGFTKNIDITVIEWEITEMSVVAGTIDAILPYGEDLDTSTLQIDFTFADGDTERVDADDANLTIGTIDNTNVGETNLSITYYTYQDSITIEVVIIVEEITVINGTLASVICQGHTLDTSNLAVNVTFNNGQDDQIISVGDLTLGSIDTSVLGEQNLSIAYGGVSINHIVNVVELEIESMQVVAGTIDTEIALGSVFSTDDIQVQFTYVDGVVETIGASDLTLGSVDTLVEGTQNLSVQYNGQTFNIEITIVAEGTDIYEILGLESALLTDYNNNKASQTNKQEEFYDLTEPLYVGTDNAFNFRITAQGMSDEGYNPAISQIRTVITVEIENGNDYNVLSGQDLANYVSVDTVNTALDFTSNAVGEVFRVTVRAFKYAEGCEANCTFTAILNVVEGYNVYNAKELSVFDNSNKNGVWTSFKAEHGLTGITTDAIILQNDINITREDIPTGYLWSTSTTDYDTKRALTDQTLEGSLMDMDDTGIYERVVANGDTFRFIGNYFSVSAVNMPKMVVERGDTPIGVNVSQGAYMTAHTSLFFTKPQSALISEGTGVEFKNIMFIGNGTLNTDPINSGAIIMMKNTGLNLHAYNTLTHNFYITYFFNDGERDNEHDGEYMIEKCKGYNSYQCLFYFWGAEHVVIKDSEFMNAGGPAIIADHHGYKYVSGEFTEIGYYTTCDIINSNIVSNVSGQEPWFTVYDAAVLAVQIFTYLEALYSNTDKTVINAVNGEFNQVNAMAIIKSGGAQGLTSDRVLGSIRVFASQEQYDQYYTDSIINTVGLDMTQGTSLVDAAMAYEALMVQSNNGGYVAIDGSNANGEWYNGDYASVYVYNGMGLMVSLQDRA